MPRLENGDLIAGDISPSLQVPVEVIRPEYVGKPAPSRYEGNDIYDLETIAKIRRAARIAAQALEHVRSHAKPGVTTDALDRIGHEFLIREGAYPSTLGYRGFPKSLCTSLNEVVCHGIPDNTVLQDGDILNIDITAFKDGVHGDTNATFLIGEGHSQRVLELVENTKEATLRGIKTALPGRAVNVIGRAIESYAKRFSYGVVRDFTGHGVGTHFHTGLIIPHYDSAPDYSQIIKPGMVFTIEPMLTLGTHEWQLWDDGWTVTTKDKSWTAQFEHTILVTEEGPEILTKV